MRPANLKQRTYRLLRANSQGGLHVREVARRLDGSPSGVGLALRQLEKDGAAVSRREGRNRVYQAIQASAASLEGRTMLDHFPASPQEWETQPYFLWDRNLSWREFRDLLHGEDTERRRWAVTRLLDLGRWSDIWRLTAPAEVGRELPHLRVRHQDVWLDLLGARRAAK